MNKYRHLTLFVFLLKGSLSFGFAGFAKTAVGVPLFITGAYVVGETVETKVPKGFSTALSWAGALYVAKSVAIPLSCSNVVADSVNIVSPVVANTLIVAGALYGLNACLKKTSLIDKRFGENIPNNCANFFRGVGVATGVFVVSSLFVRCRY